ncbi:T9SS type A sorting domain-containing protein [Mesonia sp.]|uniref:T9SS type A sorting domain-containing protein n=1 Tax=Mesonia sp. TaxID=1960830 RepID=UPI003F971B5A
MKAKNYFTTQKKQFFFHANHMLALLALVFTTTLTAQDVRVAGYYNDGSSSNMAATWEEDGTRNDLTSGSNFAQAKDIFIYDGDEYVAGYRSNGTSSVATVWKNGTAQSLTSYTNGTEPSYAESVFVYDDDVYVAGREYNGTNYVAKLWKNGNVQNLTDGSENAQALSVFVSDGDVYVVGTEYDYSVDGNYVDAVIKVWKNGTAQDLTNGTNYVYAESVFIDNDDVYVAGRESNGTNYIAKLWKNGNAQNLTDGSSRASANSVFVSDGDVYVAGYDGTQPRLWKNGVEETLNYNGNLDGGRAYSVYVSGSDVYVAGTLTESNNNDVCRYGTLWKNGEFDFRDAAPGCSHDTAMNSVFVEDAQLSTEPIVNLQNSVNLYPNPVEDVLHIETTTNTIQKIELFSITGQRLKSWEEQSEIHLSQFAPGSYFMKIITNDNQIMTKQILKN